MTSNVELLPCPFCGSPGEYQMRHYVDCTNAECETSGPTGDDKASAIAAWNTRYAISCGEGACD